MIKVVSKIKKIPSNYNLKSFNFNLLLLQKFGKLLLNLLQFRIDN